METNESIGKNWWKLLLRGIFAVLFGVLAFALPGVALGMLTLLFGLYVLADGIVEIGYAFSSRDWWMLIPGFLGMAVGVYSLAYPEITALSLPLIIGGWAIVRGVIDIVTAIWRRKQITGEWLMILGGVLSIILGLAIAVFPIAGVVAMAWMIGAFFIVFGAIMIIDGFQMHSRTNQIREVSHT
jgi:uncharacterized membrane protein HdeD (DUF308 family)